MGENQVEFFITFGDITAHVLLSEYDTVADLKREIEIRMNLPFDHQEIFGWHNVPESHSVILQNCVSSEGFGCLIVRDISDLLSTVNASNTPLFEQTIDPIEIDSDSVAVEIKAIQSLENKLPSNHNIHICQMAFEDAVSYLKNGSVNGKKALLLYLHNSNDAFSQTFINNLSNDLVSLINKSFFFIGWDIENQSYHHSLLSALREYDSLSVIGLLITNQTSGLLCIFYDQCGFRIFFCMRDNNVRSDHIIFNLKSAQAALSQQPDVLYSEDMEIEAIKSLKRKLPKNTALVLRHIKLDDAISFLCTAPLKERKAMLLYLHNSEQQFSRMFSKNIINGEMVEVLNRSFIVVGWDIEEKMYHDALEAALRRHVNLSILSATVANKIAMAVCIMPVANNISVFMCFKQTDSYRHMLDSLLTAEKTLQAEIEEEENLQTLNEQANQADDMNSDTLQGVFADRLGNRDYDRFEYNEHTYLKDKIGFALKGPPTNENGYDDKIKKQISHLYNVIKSTSSEIAEYKDVIEIAFIYNCTEPLPSEKINRSKKFTDYNPKTDVNSVPIFVLRKCRETRNPCRIFIDDTGRVYQTWEQYLTKNKLSECEMILPLNGRYQVKDGKVLLEKHLSPACHLDTKILQVGDIVGMAAGMASGAVFVAAAIPAITVAPAILVTAAVGGVAAGVWAIGRSIHSLVDRSIHKESMSFASSEARGAYLNIVAGALGFVGAGANVAMTQLVARGFNISQGAAYAFNTVGVLNITASGVSLVNSGYDVIDQWINDNQSPSTLTVLQLSSSVLFFGHAVYSFKGAQQLVRETQAQVLSDYHESLRSGRHRKTFNKLMKDTMRTQGDPTKANAEVISAIRNIKNKDEVFAALTRNNKEMNKNNIRFNADRGEIKFNGIQIDMNEFIGLNKKEAQVFLGKISEQSPNPMHSATTSGPTSGVNISLSNAVSNVLQDINIDVTNVLQFATEASKMLTMFNDDIKAKVVSAIHQAMYYILSKTVGPLFDEIDRVLPKRSRFSEFLQLGIAYFSKEVNKLERKYQRYQNTGDKSDYHPLFDVINPLYAKRAITFFEYVVQLSFQGETLTKIALQEISRYLSTRITQLIFEDKERKERENRRKLHSAGYRPQRINCAVCKGYHFKN